MSNAIERVKVGLVAAIVLGMAPMQGCLISSSSNESYSGTYVSPETFGQVKPGETTQQWLLGTLGEPTQKTTLESGEELWKWSYSKVKQSSGAVFLIFGGSSNTTTGGAAYAQLKDGVVTKAWRAG